MLVIGPYRIRLWDEEHVWIEHASGEGGTFTRREFLDVIEKFYGERF